MLLEVLKRRFQSYDLRHIAKKVLYVLRRLLMIHWEKKKENYIAMSHFACAWITCRAKGIFG